MIPFAHVGGVPVEEMLPAFGGPGVALVMARAWLALRLRKPCKRADSDMPEEGLEAPTRGF